MQGHKHGSNNCTIEELMRELDVVSPGSFLAPRELSADILVLEIVFGTAYYGCKAPFLSWLGC